MLNFKQSENSHGARKIILENVRLMILATVFSLGLGIALAWTDPVSAPPTGNALTPINRSSSAQVKSGGLWAGSFGVDNGMVVMGNLGVGTTTPSSKLSVTGTIESASGGFKFPDGTVQTTAAGGDLPSGAVMAFYLDTCPDGWIIANGNNNTPDLRGMFIRGAGTNGNYTTANGTYYTAAYGTEQTDQIQGHWHITTDSSGRTITAPGGGPVGGSTNRPAASPNGSDYITAMGAKIDGTNGTPRIGVETRPANFVLTYCMKE